MNNKKDKNVIKKVKTNINVFEYAFIFIILLIVSFFINKNIIIKGLFMDDLYHWSWYRWVKDIFEFSFKFYDNNTRYRPIFEFLQYIIYTIVDTDPMRLTVVNKVLNSLVALFIYHFAKKLSKNKYIAIVVSSLYLVSHYAYYQIGQGIGSLETEAQFFSLVILYYCIKLTGGFDTDKELNKNDNIKNIMLIYIFYFLVVFTHERFLGLLVPIIISILFMKEYKVVGAKKNKENEYRSFKIKSIIIYMVEIFSILLLRFLAIGKVVPAGTGGTYVEDTFNLMECIKNCFNQVAIVFGINIGPEHLYGIDFKSIPNTSIKLITYISIVLIIFTFIYYLYIKINSKNKNFITDILILSFIAMCIGASSVTIRVELRFVYVSFTAALIYLSYILGYISNEGKKNNNNKIAYNKKALITSCFIITLIAITRLPIELEYRKYFNKIHCYIDQNRMNSLYDNTIGVYGVDTVLHNKKIYVQNNFFGMTDFYAEYFYKIYDKEDIGNKIILFNDINELTNIDKENAIILLEDLENNKYIVY